MKKFLIAISLIFFGLTIYGQSYEDVERATPFGLIPILSDTNDRTDGHYLPSLLASNKKGYGYIDCNFTKGGLIVPFLGRTLVFSAWYENGTSRNLVDIKGIMALLQPAGPTIPDTRHLMGFGFAANLTDKWSLGLNFRYLLGRYFEEKDTATDNNSHKIDTDRIELNPSFTFRSGSFFADFGIALNFQWMTEKAEGSFEYDRATTYDGNVDFSFFGRGGFAVTQYSDMVISTGFGVLPISEKQLGASSAQIAEVELNSFFWNFKVGSLIKPQKWMRIHPAVMLSLYHLDKIQTQINVATPEKSTSKNNIFALSMMLGLDITPVEWFSLKAGVAKDFNVIDDTTSKVVAETVDSNSNLRENLGAYFGPSFMWKGFTFTSMINLDFFTKGPYIISGDKLTDWAYVATVEYQW